jgi:flagellar hook-associated protein FlgK
MHLTSALYNSLSGLRSSQTGIDLVSRNVANAGTDGYTRKTSDTEHVVLDGRGAGVRRLPAEREIDLRVQRELRIEQAGTSRLDVVDSFLQRVDQLYGRPDEEVSFASSVQRLSGSFQQLADKPEDPTLRNAVLGDAEHLARDLNDMSDAIQRMRLEADQGIVESVGIVNEALHSIKDLNEKIATRTQGGRSAADLEDQRDRHLDRLSEQMDIQYFSRTNGEVVILTQTGRTLLDTQVHELNVDGRSVVTPQNLYSTDPAQRGVATITLETGMGEVDLLARNEIGNGRIAGFVEVRDTLMPQAQDQLDELAHHLASALSVGEVTASPVTTRVATTPGAFAAPAFDPFAANVSDATLDITVDGQAMTLGPFPIDAATNPGGAETAVQEALQQALDDNGLEDIAVTVTGTLPADRVIAFEDAEGREISGIALNDTTAGTSTTPALDPASQFSLLDLSSVSRPGETVSVTYIEASSGNPRTVTLTATDTATSEPDTFLLGSDPSGTAANLAAALGSVLPPSVNVTNPAGAEVRIEDPEFTDTVRLVSFSATSQTGSGEHLELFADGSGSDQTVYLGNPPGADGDQKLGFAQRIAVNEAVLSDPSVLVRYTDPTTGQPVPDGDPARPLEMLSRLSNVSRDFDDSLGLGPVNTTIEGFAIGLVSFQAGQTAIVEDELDYQTAVTESVERRHDAVSGVNVDEEMAELLFLERTYSASAQVLTAVERMLDELLAAVN